MGGSHFEQIIKYLKDGANFGYEISYVYQASPIGIAQAINLCKNSINTKQFVTILGDNVFENQINFDESDEAQIVLHKHHELHRFGVASIDPETKKIVNIVEKPKTINEAYDNFAITGCYLFDHQFFEFFKELKPSARGEYEITDIIGKYNKIGKLSYTKVNGLWSDAGTHESINFLNNFFYYKGKSL